MWSFWGANIVKGLCLGIEVEEVDGDEYLIISLVVFQIIFINDYA